LVKGSPDCISVLLFQKHAQLTVKIEGMVRDSKIELKKEGCQPVVKTIRNTQPTCVPGCYPGVVAPAGYTEILEEPTLHLAMQER
jgi:hypothetical protein